MSSLRVLRRLLPAAIRSTSLLVQSNIRHVAKSTLSLVVLTTHTHTHTPSLSLFHSQNKHTHSHARTHGAKQQFTFLMGPNAAPNNYNEIRDREAKGLKLSFSSGWRVVSFFFFFFSKSNWILARGRIFSTLCRRPTPEHRSHRCRRRRRPGCRRGRRGRGRGRHRQLMSVKPFFLRH